MDFRRTEEQLELEALAAEILTARATPERLTELEERATDDPAEWLDAALWRELGQAGLLGAALPDRYAGGGAGFTELAALCEQVGAAAAHAPVWSSVVCAALPIAAFGTAEQADRDLPGVVAGATVLTAALLEPGNNDLRSPTTTARQEGDAWLLDGVKVCVPLASVARRIVVPARTSKGAALFLVDPTTPGLTIEAATSTALEPQALLRFEGAAAEPLGDPADGAAALDWLLDRAGAALAAQQTGICERVLRMSATYTTDREQFGRPVATFQAVGHRLADAYTDTLALRLATAQAVWRIVEGLPTSDAVAVALWWSAEAGHRVTHAAHHVHGGVGVDVTYPLHRYIRWATQIEFTLGGATHQLATIGARLATEPA